MLAQSIPIASLSTIHGLLTISLNLDFNTQYCPPTDLNLLDQGSLTHSERRVIRLIGKSAKIIADKLNLSEHTVKKHIRNAMDKTGCKNSKELAAWAERNKLLIN